MDQETFDYPRIYSKPGRVRENSSDSVLEAVIVLDSGENAGVNGETGDSVSEKVLAEEQGTRLDHRAQNGKQNDAISVKDDARSSSNWIDSVHEVVVENVTAMSAPGAVCVIEESQTVVEENPKTKEEETVKHSHMIDLRSSDKANHDCERACRICHLSHDRSPEATDRVSGTSMNVDLIPLGCGCKDELGTAHVYCAEAWFKLKGNRVCEICGQTATNVTGLGNHGFMDEWNEQRRMDYGDGSFNHRRRCWRERPFCNFLMACLVTAFVLPWFFHVDMF